MNENGLRIGGDMVLPFEANSRPSHQTDNSFPLTYNIAWINTLEELVLPVTA